MTTNCDKSQSFFDIQINYNYKILLYIIYFVWTYERVLRWDKIKIGGIYYSRETYALHAFLFPAALSLLLMCYSYFAIPQKLIKKFMFCFNWFFFFLIPLNFYAILFMAERSLSGMMEILRNIFIMFNSRYVFAYVVFLNVFYDLSLFMPKTKRKNIQSYNCFLIALFLLISLTMPLIFLYGLNTKILFSY